MIAIDSNLLIYAHLEAAPEHDRARRALEDAAAHPDGWGFAVSSVTEVWAVLTHAVQPAVPASRVADYITSLIQAGARVFYPRQGFMSRLMEAACESGIHGRRIYDLQIALSAREAGATSLWTHDAKFITIDGLPTHDPL